MYLYTGLASDCVPAAEDRRYSVAGYSNIFQALEAAMLCRKTRTGSN